MDLVRESGGFERSTARRKGGRWMSWQPGQANDRNTGSTAPKKVGRFPNNLNTKRSGRRQSAAEDAQDRKNEWVEVGAVGARVKKRPQ